MASEMQQDAGPPAKAPRQQSAARRYRGLTCANCRARKVRCEGGQPTCKTCEIYHDECRYDKAPSMSQVVAMAKRLQEAEEMIEKLKAQNGADGEASTADNGDSEPQTSNTVTVPSRPAQRSMSQTMSFGDAPNSHIASQSTSRHSFSMPRAYSPEFTTPRAHHSPAADEADPTALSVDEHGKICYYGPTSAVHDPPQLDIVATPASTGHASVGKSSSKDEGGSSLAAYVRETATWEDFALGNASLQTSIPRQMLARLLNLYWTWISHMFMWVYRPAFIRDMATGGRYYSELLLTIMCGHSASYQESNCAEYLMTRARRLVGTAIQQPSSIPTVQALLQLSARDLAQGSISQAWVYSGIAFRMASDLGLQHSSSVVKGLTPLDLEIRRRLFWSCYFWDKATSLYAGRLPVMTEVLDMSTLDLLDYSTETELWAPYYGDDSRNSRKPYPPRKGHAVSCFVNSCKLSIIINDIIVQLYSKTNRSTTESAFQDIKQRLDLWRLNTPAHLKIDPHKLPSVCPPPHLVSQNLLYFTSVILAHRPFWSAPAHYQTCIAASQAIEKLILLFDSSFGLENITYLMGYCIYTGASAILEDAKGGNDAAHDTLQTYLRALNTGMRRCPLLERSLKIIVKGMHSASTTRSPAAADQLPQSGEAVVAAPANSYLPAFPYIDPTTSMEFDANPFFGANMDSLSGLDCFPEAQMDLSDFVDPPL